MQKTSDIIEKFLAHHQHSAPATYIYYAQLRVLKHGDVTTLKPHHVTTLMESGATPRLMKLAKACFKWAKEQGHIDNNPFEGVKLKKAPSRGDEAYLSSDQLDQLLLYSNDLHDLVVVLKETGCRPQELRAVEARHLDGKCWVFPVSESKGKLSSRIVHLSQHALEICTRLAVKYPSGPLFRNSDGAPWTADALAGRFERLSKKLDFPVTAYSLRHSFASNAIIAGIDLITIATLMGHSNLKMLSEVYQHVQKRGAHLEAAIERMQLV